MNLKYFAGRALSWPSAALLRASWFPLLRTFRLRQNWAYDICRFAGTRKIRTIFDVGANIGQTANFAANFFPHAVIHSFEPVQATFATLRARTKKSPNVHAHRLALGRRTEVVEIALQEDALFNSLAFRRDGSSTAGPTERIQVTTLDEFCAAHHIAQIDILKTDAQAFDLEVLQGAAELVARSAVCFVYTEVGFLDGDKYSTPFVCIDQHLRANGFQLAGFYEQAGVGPRARVLGFCNALYAHPAALEHRFASAQPAHR